MIKEMYKYFTGPAHGWLKVPIKDIPEHIRGAISPFSYRAGPHAFLEEDVDMPLFLRETGAEFTSIPIDDESPIRNLPSWQNGRNGGA